MSAMKCTNHYEALVHDGFHSFVECKFAGSTNSILATMSTGSVLTKNFLIRSEMNMIATTNGCNVILMLAYGNYLD
ncbi:hypothetical protein RYX36_019673 [Vicia faba]